MTASKVRADYEQLTRIAQAFGQQAESAQKTLSALQSNLSTLQAGDWVGKGSDAFYAEMSSAVLPAMGRVAAAMKEAANTTTRISDIIKQAEADAAALFKLDGNGAPGGMDAGTVSAFASGPDGSGGAAPSGTRHKAKYENNRHDPSGTGLTPTREMSPKLKEMVAVLDPQVQEWIMASPALKVQLEKMANSYDTFKVAPTLDDVYIGLRINSKVPKDQFQEVVGWAAIRTYRLPYFPTPAPGNYEEFMKYFDVNREAYDGAILFNQIAVWQDNPEGLLHRPQDPSGRPMTPAEFAEGRRIYGQWVVGNISTKEAIQQMGAFHGRQPLPPAHYVHGKFNTYRDVWLAAGQHLWEREAGF